MSCATATDEANDSLGRLLCAPPSCCAGVDVQETPSKSIKPSGRLDCGPSARELSALESAARNPLGEEERALRCAQLSANQDAALTGLVPENVSHTLLATLAEGGGGQVVGAAR